MVVAGQWADVGEALLNVAIGDRIKVSARVPEAWAPELAGLEQFTFTVGVSGPTFTAKLYSVQPVVEHASRSFEIVGSAANDGSIKPGMFANVVLEAPTVKQTLWLPVAAVATSDLSQVLLIEDGVIVVPQDPDRSSRRRSHRNHRWSVAGGGRDRRCLRSQPRPPRHRVGGASDVMSPHFEFLSFLVLRWRKRLIYLTAADVP